jgi:hypothetical protein
MSPDLPADPFLDDDDDLVGLCREMEERAMSALDYVLNAIERGGRLFDDLIELGQDNVQGAGHEFLQSLSIDDLRSIVLERVWAATCLPDA